MDIARNSTYFNKVMQAIVVDTDISNNKHKENDSKTNEHKVQVYIPEVHGLGKSYADYKAYMNSSNKKEHKDYESYSWVFNTISDLKIGDLVYVTNLGNRIGNYVIIGRDASCGGTTGSGGIGGGSDDSMTAGDIAELAIRIILFNECGIGHPPLYEDGWADNIPDSKFGTYTTRGTSTASGGLLQWDAARLYDLLLEIAKSDGNWENLWDDKEYTLYKILKHDIVTGSNSYSDNKNAISSSSESIRNSIISMLKSNAGKQLQIKKAREEITDLVQTLTEDTGITNPAMLIMMADWANQHTYKSVDASGWKNSIYREIYEAAQDPLSLSISTTDLDKELSTYDNPTTMMKEVETWCIWFVDTWYPAHLCRTEQGIHGLYCPRRRKTTLAYIRELYKQGKLVQAGMSMLGNLRSYTYKGLTLAYPFADEGELISTTYGSEFGSTYQYPAGHRITSLYGLRSLKGSEYHGGIDFGITHGETYYASHDGTLKITDSYKDSWKDSSGKWHWTGTYGCLAVISFELNGDKWEIYYGHMLRGSTSQFGYEVNGTYQVKAGQPIGQGNSTGDSTGDHLHYEIRRNGYKVNPLPYLGLGNTHNSLSDAKKMLEE